MNLNSIKIIKLAASISGLSGLVILIVIFWPIIEYQFFSSNNYKTLLSPLVAQPQSYQKTDYTKASTWFPSAETQAFVGSEVKYYNISIPKLDIRNAVVAIGGEDLTKYLVQYPGTALPGKRGNAVIFGHSVLPIFYNPKSYKAIFSTLPTLKKGDDVFVTYDGVDYHYVIEEMFEIYPSDIQILEQNNSDSFLTLVTCVPPGDPRNPKRLIVRARVVS